jgi:hypothetical protein
MSAMTGAAAAQCSGGALFSRCKENRVFHQNEKEFTIPPVLRYSSGH